MSILKEKKLLTKENFQLDSNKSEKFYPRCDCSVWLRSCEKEILKPISGKVQGHIPIWLSGNLLRNGPGNLNVDKMRFHHLFDSAALLHKLVPLKLFNFMFNPIEFELFCFVNKFIDLK